MTEPLVVAVDIGATKTLLTVRSARDLAAGWRPDGPVARAGSHAEPGAFVDWVETETEVARAATSSAGVVAAIAVAAPGPLDAASGVVTRSSNLGWQDVPLASMLRARLGAPVVLEDDANSAALGEWHYGAGAGTDPLGYLTVSSGIGGGLVAGGASIRGARGNAGEVGHIVIDPEGPRCACGRRGDVESFAGGAAMARRARHIWPRALTADGQPAPRTAEDVFRAARRGDAQATGLVTDATAALATALAAMAAVVEPEVIVVGGSIGLGQPRMMRKAVALARKRVMRENAATLRVVPAALGQESVLAGAADLGLRLIAAPGDRH